MRIGISKLPEPQELAPMCKIHGKRMVPGTYDIETYFRGERLVFNTMEVWKCPEVGCSEMEPKDDSSNTG